MKRMVPIVLLLALLLTACGNAKKAPATPQTPTATQTPTTTLPAETESETAPDLAALDVLTKVWDAYTEDEKFPAAGGDEQNPVDDAPGTVSIDDPEALSFSLTLPTDAAALIDGAAAITHMMNLNTFTCGAFHLKNGDDAQAVAQLLRDSIQAKHWMCGFPDKFVVFTLPKCVVSVYGNEDLVNNFRDKLLASGQDAVIAFEEAIA